MNDTGFFINNMKSLPILAVILAFYPYIFTVHIITPIE